MNTLLVVTTWLAVLPISLSGCSKMPRTFNSSWHAKYGWKAEDCFDDPLVIALCRAIEANDLEEIDRLLVAGADVNAKGKGNMTPLLWAFPDNKVERFKRLLEHGADPNVIVQSDFNTKGGIHRGLSVTHMAAKSTFPDHFKYVMQHGGNPDLIDAWSGDSVLHAVIKAGLTGQTKRERLQLLIDKGANPDVLCGDATPAMTAVGWGGQYHIALMLLRAGADPCAYPTRSNKKLVHVVVEEERVNRSWSPQAKADYQALVNILQEHGESVQKAREDLDRWLEWSKTYEPAKFGMLIKKEVEDRKAREQVQAEKAASGRGEQ